MSQISASRLISEVAAGPNVFNLSLRTTPMPASIACTRIMQEATATSHSYELLNRGTRQIAASAVLRAVAYSALMRDSPSAERTAAIEKPRLTSALVMVMAAQSKNGVVIWEV
jgi:hypothetical protein